MAESRIVVIGAGVAGLTTAVLLARKGYSVTVVAKHQPGDYDIEYASPWAGANFLPFSPPGSAEQRWEKNTFPELWRLANEVPEAGIHVQDTQIFNRKKDENAPLSEWVKDLCSSDPWWKDLVPGFRVLEKHELPTPDIDSGTTFKSVCINTALYLPYLVGQCRKHGAVVKRGVLNHVKEAADMHHSGKRADIVVNCTGLMANKLGGVMDKKVFPARGQIVLVRNEGPTMMTISGTDDSYDDSMYIMMRASGGGTILGGCYQKGNYASDVDHNLAARILRRSAYYYPEMVNGKGVDGFDIIRHGVGLRPLREGGPRIEAETIDGVKVVHNYGAGSFGYQASYAMSNETVDLVEKSLRVRAKL